MRDYKLYMKDILSAINSIEAFVEGMKFDSGTQLFSGKKWQE